MLTFRPAETRDSHGCLSIVRGLPDHFTDDVPGKVAADLQTHQGWVAEDSSLIGFVVVARPSPRAAEILWIGVRSGSRGNGWGTRLLDHALAALREEGVDIVMTKTLDASADYEPYVATRAFWERSGFVQVDCIDPLPGWPPGNPCAIYVASLAPTR